MPAWMPAWFLEWADTVSLLTVFGWVVGIAGVFVAIRFIYRKGWPWLKTFANAIINTAEIIDSVKDLPEFIERTDAVLQGQDKQIAEIHHEVHYNNGSSVKDAVARVESGVAALRKELDNRE